MAGISRLLARAGGRGCLTALLAVSLAAPAAADFDTPVLLSRSGLDGFSPRVALDADGDAVVVWLAEYGAADCCLIEARSRSGAGVLGPIQTISTGEGQDPDVAVGPAGNAFFVWEGTRILARTRSAAGVLGPFRVISLAGELDFAPRVVAGPNGDALITWTAFNGLDFRLRSRTLSAANVLGSVQTFSLVGVDVSHNDLAIDGSGNAIAVWTRTQGAGFATQARRRSAAGQLGPVLNLGSAVDTSVPAVAFSANGDALVAWQAQDGANTVIRVRPISAAGVVGPLRTMSGPGQAGFPQVALDGDGDALVAWADDTPDDVLARTRAASGIVGPIRNVSAPALAASAVNLGMAADGAAVLTWEANNRIQARTRAANGLYGPVETVSAGGGAFGHLAVAPDGDAVAVWSRNAGAFSRIEAAAGP